MNQYGTTTPLERERPGEPRCSTVRLDASPLVAFVEARGSIVGQLGPQGHRDLRAYQRAKESGQVNLALAEDLCDRLGVHPTQVFGQAYLDAGAAA